MRTPNEQIEKHMVQSFIVTVTLAYGVPLVWTNNGGILFIQGWR